jgi:hypothetical protein
VTQHRRLTSIQATELQRVKFHLRRALRRDELVFSYIRHRTQTGQYGEFEIDRDSAIRFAATRPTQFPRFPFTLQDIETYPLTVDPDAKRTYYRWRTNASAIVKGVLEQEMRRDVVEMEIIRYTGALMRRRPRLSAVQHRRYQRRLAFRHAELTRLNQEIAEGFRALWVLTGSIPPTETM